MPFADVFVELKLLLERYASQLELVHNTNEHYYLNTPGGGLQRQGLVFQVKDDKRIRSFYFVTNRQLNDFLNYNFKGIRNAFERFNLK